MEEVVRLEEDFIDDTLFHDLLGMNAVLMKQYVQFVADRLLRELGYPTIWKVTNPFPFMDILLEGKTNFNERRVTEYKKLTQPRCQNLQFDTDF